MKPGQCLREDWFPVMWNGEWTFAADAGAARLKTVAAEVTKRLNMPLVANGEAGRASPDSVAERKSARKRPRGAAGLWSKIRKMQRKFSLPRAR